jgi:hypothetical protein
MMMDQYRSKHVAIGSFYNIILTIKIISICGFKLYQLNFNAQNGISEREEEEARVEALLYKPKGRGFDSR